MVDLERALEAFWHVSFTRAIEPMLSDTIRTGDIPPSVLEEAANRLSHYSVGLVKMPSPDDAMLGGSGTLVRAGDYHAILTAAHVAEAIWTARQFGVLLPRFSLGQLHRVVIETQCANKFLLPRKRNLDSSEPPDIALITIPENHLGIIKASKSFYNLSQVLPDTTEHKFGFWALYGFAEEWTRNGTPGRGYQRVLVFNGRILWGLAEPLRVKQRADGWSMTFEKKPDYDGPTCFGGYSGGGLWQNLVRTRGEQILLGASLLSGVAYYQSGFQNGSNTILCNGRRCILTLLENLR